MKAEFEVSGRNILPTVRQGTGNQSGFLRRDTSSRSMEFWCYRMSGMWEHWWSSTTSRIDEENQHQKSVWQLWEGAGWNLKEEVQISPRNTAIHCTGLWRVDIQIAGDAQRKAWQKPKAFDSVPEENRKWGSLTSLQQKVQNKVPTTLRRTWWRWWSVQWCRLGRWSEQCCEKKALSVIRDDLRQQLLGAVLLEKPEKHSFE